MSRHYLARVGVGRMSWRVDQCAELCKYKFIEEHSRLLSLSENDYMVNQEMHEHGNGCRYGKTMRIYSEPKREPDEL